MAEFFQDLSKLEDGLISARYRAIRPNVRYLKEPEVVPGSSEGTTLSGCHVWKAARPSDTMSISKSGRNGRKEGIRMKRFAALTIAGASLFSVVALQKRGVLPRVRVDTAKAREAVTFTRPQGKHGNPVTEDDNLS